MKTMRQIYHEMNNGPDGRTTNKGDFERGGYFRCHVDLYEDLFAPYREKATKVFEIGINKGGSIRMWQEYFPNAQIFGMDSNRGIVNNMRVAKVPRVTALRVNQNDIIALQQFAHDHGSKGFDIGIDDGSHLWGDQIQTFEILWPTIKDGGLYVIEDTLNSYYYKEGNTGPSAVDYFKHLVDVINFWGKDDVSKPVEFQSTIDWIGFRYNAIFIKKQFIKHDT